MRLAEVKTIRQQRQAGKTLKEIAAQAGRAVPTIRHYTRDLGRRAPRWAEAETPRLQEYWGSGMPVKEIAAQMHRSVRLIQAKARKLGLRRKP
jgi:DNA-binding CsgD family transcriptional regulator